MNYLAQGMRVSDYLICEHISDLARRDFPTCQMYALLNISNPCWRVAEFAPGINWEPVE